MSGSGSQDLCSTTSPELVLSYVSAGMVGGAVIVVLCAGILIEIRVQIQRRRRCNVVVQISEMHFSELDRESTF